MVGYGLPQLSEASSKYIITGMNTNDLFDSQMTFEIDTDVAELKTHQEWRARNMMDSLTLYQVLSNLEMIFCAQDDRHLVTRCLRSISTICSEYEVHLNSWVEWEHGKISHKRPDESIETYDINPSVQQGSLIVLANKRLRKMPLIIPSSYAEELSLALFGEHAEQAGKVIQTALGAPLVRNGELPEVRVRLPAKRYGMNAITVKSDENVIEFNLAANVRSELPAIGVRLLQVPF